MDGDERLHPYNPTSPFIKHGSLVMSRVLAPPPPNILHLRHDSSPLTTNCGGGDDSGIRRSIVSTNYDAKYSTSAKNYDSYSSSSSNINNFERTRSD
jgi:hypothetical protein